MGKTVALCGFYGKQNLGDDLMAQELPRLLGREGACEVQVYSDKRHENISNGMATGEHLEADVIVLGGGGIVGPGFWAFKQDGLRKLAECGKPIAFVNVNVTPDYLQDEDFVRGLRDLKARWWVRDSQSVTLLAEKGIESSLVADISFLEGVASVEDAVPSRQIVVFPNAYVLHRFFGKTDPIAAQRAELSLRVLADFLDWMAAFGWKTLIMAAQTDTAVDDRIAGALLYGYMNPKNAQWVSEKLTWAEQSDLIASSGLVYSMRYHATTLAMAAGVPVVDITHHLKNRSLLSDMDVLDISVEYEALSHATLLRATQTAEKSQEIKDKIIRYRVSAQRGWERFSREWEAFLASPTKAS